VSHQFRHAVDDDYGVVTIFESIKCRHEARRVFAVHYVDDKHNVRLFEIVFDVEPFAIAEWRSEVVGGYRQVKLIDTIDLALRVPQRRQ